jgi:CDP-glucose 4,6-dehydratase
MNSAFWRGKRVFLTGHTGFKGSWLSLWLQELGAQLVGYALPPPTCPSLFEEAWIDQGMESILGDVRDLPALQQAIQAARPEIVLHLAAQPLVRYSYQNPVETYSTNVMGTVNVLEAVRMTPGVRSVVVITTDKCYENREWVWGYRECEPMGGHDPYSNSKGCVELVCAAYRSSFFSGANTAGVGVALATARAGNVIGGGDWAADRLIPDIVAAFQKGEAVRIRNPHAVRPWQHVLEPLRGYLDLAERQYMEGRTFSEAWNFGPYDDDALPVVQIVEKMAAAWGEGARWACDNASHPHEAQMLKLDISKARAQLGWQPVLRINDALDLTVEWARERQAGADARQLTLAQIRKYSKFIEY